MTPPSNPSSIYLDSNALIGVLEAHDGHEHVVQALELARQRKLDLYVSTLSYVEVRGWGNADPYPPQRDKAALALLDSPSLVSVEFSRGVGLKAREIAYTYRLKTPDAIHVASAIHAGAEVLFTRDGQMRGRGRIEGVLICEPYEIGEPTIFGSNQN
ncbi:PIN domain-containing protein [Microbispora sp. NBC_01189]|uniref:type II toxin-antitoxin system VapC family toxin n=1 Tax=Microbispora sp. NBC_01189 TaxID=2903583 RepID=UPI002E0F7CB7|nr:PIN domain-containing protein [Microbispora sp. NBC_01189]